MPISPRLVARAVLLLCVPGLFLTFFTPAALAHDSLKSSSPARGAVVADVREIQLEFHDRVSFPAVVLHNAAGKRFESGAPRAQGPKVFEGVAGPVPPGAYVIAWRIVSSDGHPVEGEIPFTVAGTASQGSSGASAPQETSAPPSLVAAVPTDDGTSAPASGLPGWVWIGLAVLLSLAGVLAVRATRAPAPEPSRGADAADPLERGERTDGD